MIAFGGTALVAATLAQPASATPLDDWRAQAQDALNQGSSAVGGPAAPALPDVGPANDAIRQGADAIRGANLPLDQGSTAVLDQWAPAAPAPAPAPAPEPAPAPAEATSPDVDTSRCAPSARVCVDRENHKSWLQENGHVSYGPVTVSTGKAGEETPAGTFHVTRKVKDEISHEFHDAPMPNSVYFTDNGHAFHADDPAVASNGCVHLTYQDSQVYFDTLQIGDEVNIF